MLRMSQMYTDSDGRGLVFLVGQPFDPSWMQSVRNASSVMMQARIEGKHNGGFNVSSQKDPFHHRRGNYYAVPSGISLFDITQH